MTSRAWRAAALALTVMSCDAALAQTGADKTMDMAAVIALLQQQQRDITEQQRELAQQRDRLDAQADKITEQAGKITALTHELDAMRGAPDIKPTAPAGVATEHLAEAAPQQPAQHPEAVTASVGTQLETTPSNAPTVAANTITETAVASAQADDPTQDLLNQFPGAWRLPGTDAALRIGGFIRTAIVYNFDILTVPDRFIVGSIPVQQPDLQNNATQSSITANQSRLDFDYRNPTRVGIMRAYIEGDFTGENNTFNLRHAFGQWNRVLAGQTWSAFVDTDSTPEEVDFEGLNGWVNVRQSQVRFSPKIGQDFELELSLEDPNPQLQNGSGVTRIPDLVLAGSFQPNNRLHLRTALLGRQIRGQEDAPDSGELEAGVEKTYAWGVSISGSITTPLFDSRDRFVFQLNKGNGIGRYVNDLRSIGNYDGIFNESNSELQLFNVFAGYGSLQHWWDDTLRSNFTFGWVDINNPEFIDEDAYERTMRASVNLIWNPVQQVDTGIEYLWGRREDKSGDHGDAQQLQMMIRYTF